MNNPQFFTTHSWWGKLIGGFFGFLMAGPLGALFGLLVGNFFDRGLMAQSLKLKHPFHAEKSSYTKAIFIEAIFSAMGHIAKSDGKISPEEITQTQAFIDELNLSSQQKKQAQKYFIAGKSPSYPLSDILIKLQSTTHQNPQLLRLFLDKLYTIAKVDGFTRHKINTLNFILSTLGFSGLDQQQPFQKDYYRQSQQQKVPQRPKVNLSSQEAYQLLNISPGASQQEIKRAYRKLMSRYHPDKLIAKNATPEQIKQATEKTQLIRKAYDLLTG
jgi:DnaJ like chaperone protein